jgi:hypothetical protein
MYSASFPPKIPSLWRPLPSTGSLRERFPCFIGTIWRSDFLPPFSSGFVAFTFRYHYSTCLFAPTSGAGASQRGYWRKSPVPPVRTIFNGDGRISQVPGGPLCLHALLSDPGGILSRLLSGDQNIAFRWLKDVGFHIYRLRGSITRPANSLCTLHRLGYPSLRNTRYRLPARLAG